MTADKPPYKDDNTELRTKAHEAMDKYLDAGGPFEFVIMARRDMERNFGPLREAIVEALHPERNGVLIKSVAEGASYEHIVIDQLLALFSKTLEMKTKEAGTATLDKVLRLHRRTFHSVEDMTTLDYVSVRDVEALKPPTGEK